MVTKGSKELKPLVYNLTPLIPLSYKERGVLQDGVRCKKRETEG